jgi:ApaG protein
MKENMEQANLVSAVTRGVRISVLPNFLEEKSDPKNSQYAFAYTVEIVNEGSEVIQLINRHWRIESGGKQIGDVKGAGVVGEQPVLQPGETYTYSSWAMIEDPIGAMEGSYTFVSATEEFFDVPIPRFRLIHGDDAILN